MKRSSEFRIADILQAIEQIEEYVKGIQEDEFIDNSLIHDAVLRNIEIIGEAANHVEPEIKKQYPNVEWSDIIGMRNIISHDYTEVDLPLVFETVKKFLPQLKKALQKLTK